MASGNGEVALPKPRLEDGRERPVEGRDAHRSGRPRKMKPADNAGNDRSRQRGVDGVDRPGSAECRHVAADRGNRACAVVLEEPGVLGYGEVLLVVEALVREEVANAEGLPPLSKRGYRYE
jgi:hypothetical protein